MRMNNVEMNETMLDQVNGGVIEVTVNKEQHRFRFMVCADDDSKTPLGYFESASTNFSLAEVEYLHAKKFALEKNVSTDLTSEDSCTFFYLIYHFSHNEA